jgi:SpoVK/Ycf46/Vps4 family AAA+-type ATPase
LDDLVLPPDRMAQLHELAHSAAREGAERNGAITALFAGASGSGKTMAAEALANNLARDLLRIDLGAVVNKYIGETQMQLDRLFAAAEAEGAVLLLDEADALFGKRSEVKDSHDRYANIEVSYLLQRMETFAGLVILTTNRKRDIDAAFLRRLRYVVEFPFPHRAARDALWRRALSEVTTLEPVDIGRLATLQVNGGAIAGIVRRAEDAAAAAAQPVDLRHILTAARHEHARLGIPLTSAEFGDPDDAAG